MFPNSPLLRYVAKEMTFFSTSLFLSDTNDLCVNAHSPVKYFLGERKLRITFGVDNITLNLQFEKKEIIIE